MQIIVGGKIVGYDSIGESKKTVLLLHGWGADRKSLKVLARKLSKKLRVISVDVPGFGESAPPEKPWSLDDYQAWSIEFLAKLGVDKLYACVGHSNGGAIAIKLVSSGFPTDRLVLLGASGVRSREVGRKIVYKVVAKTGKTATRLMPKKLRVRLRKKWYKTIGSELYDVQGMEETFKKVTGEDLVIDAGMISVPTLLMYGSNDQATPVLYGKIYSEVIEGSELDIVEGAGHYSFIDKPDEVLRRVEEFLR